MDTNAQILNELKNLSGRMSQMESKMETFSATSPSTARSSCSQRSPTLSTLRQSRSIQEQVDTWIKELQAVDKEKGKFKSERGGSETIWVKNEIA